MTLLHILQGLTCISIFGLGIFVIARNSSQETAWYFFLFTIGTALWNLCLFITISHTGQPILWGRLAISFGSLMPAGFSLFLSSFPQRNKRFCFERTVIIILAIFFFLISLSPWVVRDAWVVNNTYIMGTFGKFYLVFWSYYLGFLTLSFIRCIWKHRHTEKQTHKVQLYYITLGFALFFFPLLVTQFICPLFGVFEFNSYGPFFSLPMIFVISYAIIRHQLMDIRIIIQRGLIYIILLAIIASAYICGLILLGYLLHLATTMTTIISAGITMTLGIFFMQPLKLYFQKVTDNIFFKDAYGYADALHQLSKILHTNVTQADIISASSALLEKIFKASWIIFRLVSDTTKPIVPSMETAYSLPIIFEERQIGLLELGPKRSGDSYSRSDIQLLETFVYQAAVALEKGQLYEKVETYNAQLEQLVEDRTKEIKKLQEDQKQAMIDISHNLQTPLAVIQGELELLGDTTEGAHKIHAVQKSLDRVSEFIRQLLHLSRLEHSIYTIELSPLDLGALVEEQGEYFQVMGHEKGVDILLPPKKQVMILGNKRLLEELLSNLVVNAITYRNTERKSTIVISLIDTRTHVKILIEDNGTGIVQEELPELFTRFYRGSARKSHSLQGTGLGLAICKKIVEKHNGTISVLSMLGEKTVFTITLPKAL